jgi:hypothetical protein
VKDDVADDVAESAVMVADTDAVSRGDVSGDVSMTWLMSRILMLMWQVTWHCRGRVNYFWEPLFLSSLPSVLCCRCCRRWCTKRDFVILLGAGGARE